MTELAVSSDLLIAPRPASLPSSASARATGVAAVVAGAIGLLGLAAWMLDPDTMRREVVGGLAMSPNTALTFVIASASLWIKRRPRAGTSWLHIIALALGAVVLLLGGVSVAERAFDLHLGISRILFANRLGTLTDLP